MEQLREFLTCLPWYEEVALDKMPSNETKLYLPVGTTHTPVTKGQTIATMTVWGPGGQGGTGNDLIAGGGGGSGAVIQSVTFSVSSGYSIVTMIPTGTLIGHVSTPTVVQILDNSGIQVGSVTVDAGKPGAAGSGGTAGLIANSSVIGARFAGKQTDGVTGGAPGASGTDSSLTHGGRGGKPGGSGNQNGGGGAGGFGGRMIANGGVGAAPISPGSSGIPGSGGPGAGGGGFNASKITQPSTAFGLGGIGGVLLTLT